MCAKLWCFFLSRLVLSSSCIFFKALLNSKLFMTFQQQFKNTFVPKFHSAASDYYLYYSILLLLLFVGSIALCLHLKYGYLGFDKQQ